MSMELIIVLAINSTPSRAEWQEEAEIRKIPIEIAVGIDTDGHSGFIPIKVNEENSGMYFSREPFLPVSERHPKLNGLGDTSSIIYTFGYGGLGLECAAAFYSAAALVSGWDAAVFEPQGGTFLDYNKLVEAAQFCEGLGASDG